MGGASACGTSRLGAAPAGAAVLRFSWPYNLSRARSAGNPTLVFATAEHLARRDGDTGEWTKEYDYLA